LESLCHYLEYGDSLSITVRENDFVNIIFNLPGQLPETLLSLIRDPINIFKIDRSKARLKLYLAKRVAETHRWLLSAENGQPSVITMTIPKIERLKVEAIIENMVEGLTEFITELMDINVCSIMLEDEFTGDLLIKGAIGLDEDIIRRTRLRIGDNIAGWVALEGKPLLIEDIENDPRFVKKNLSQYNTKSLLSLPLKINGKVIGVLNLNNKKDSKPFTVRDLYIAQALSERVSFILKRLYSQEYSGKELKNYLKTFEGLVSAIRNYHKKNGVIHDLVSKIMDYLGVDEDTRNLALYTSMLYDIGLMLASEDILRGKSLTPTEVKALRVHPYITITLLNSFEFSEDVRRAIIHHHEKYDGTGYPEGLKGEEIPLVSRVLSVVDSFNAMVSDRPYRDKLSPEEALQEIKRQAGTFYDPKIVNALVMVVET
ncbi:MAG: HD-GYP domain-containing protein, partial [Thermodesulfovibrionales bacterium]